MNATTPLRTALDGAAPSDLREDQPGRHAQASAPVTFTPAAAVCAGLSVAALTGAAYGVAEAVDG
ncbi:hypothetical protein AAH978_19880 [Streptomyces sp. ZYX-F-203]